MTRLILQIERELVEIARLRLLVSDGEQSVSGHRRELRTVKTRVDRARKATRPHSKAGDHGG